MVRVTFTEGPHASMTLTAPGLTPLDVLCGPSQYRWRWETDYADATADEQALWSRQDLTAHCVRTLSQGLPIRFGGETYHSQGLEGAFQVAARIEEKIAASGQEVVILSDDEQGLTLAVK